MPLQVAELFDRFVLDSPMDDQQFAELLRSRIGAAHGRLGVGLGWRLLYSPSATLSTASVAFIGLNPGGGEGHEDEGTLAMPPGTSAYVHESWKNKPPGTQALQLQVREVFRRVRQEPHEVLAGNLIPFRTPSRDELPDLAGALAFGVELWSEIIERSHVTTIVTMGRDVERALGPSLGVHDVRPIPVAWEPHTGAVARWRGGRFISLPHLSRFGIMRRAPSAEAVAELFADWSD